MVTSPTAGAGCIPAASMARGVAEAVAGLGPDLDPGRGIAAFTPDGRALPPPDDPVLAVSDRVVGPAGVPVRLYRPPTADGAGALVLHGGGFINGSPALGDTVLREWALELGIVIAAPTYRLAPGHPYPAALEDCRAALRWFISTGINPGRLAVYGVSSGGALATALALERGDGMARLVLQCPALDDRLNTASMRAIQDPRVWNAGMAALSWEAYLGADLESRRSGSAEVPAAAAPARAEDLSHLPPTTITINQHDPLRDEALTFAHRLSRAGVPVEAHLFAGTVHGSMGLAPDAKVSRAERTVLRAALRRV